MKLNKLHDLPGLLNQLTKGKSPHLFPPPQHIIVSSFDFHHNSRKKSRLLNKTQIVVPTHDIGREAFNTTSKKRRPHRSVRHRTLSLSFANSIIPREQKSVGNERPSSSRAYKNPLIKVMTPKGAYCQYSKKL